jgi:hypothetical protein
MWNEVVVVYLKTVLKHLAEEAKHIHNKNICQRYSIKARVFRIRSRIFCHYTVIFRLHRVHLA